MDAKTLGVCMIILGVVFEYILTWSNLSSWKIFFFKYKHYFKIKFKGW